MDRRSPSSVAAATGMQAPGRPGTPSRGSTPTQAYRPPTPTYGQPPNTGYQPPGTGYQAPNAGYQPPNTGYQPPSSGYQPPSTGYRRPGSAAWQRPGTPGAGAGVVPVYTDVQVADRPVTQQGVAGMRTAAPPGTALSRRRQVQDRSYFLSLLRSRRQDLVSESSRLATEAERLREGSQAAGVLQRRREEVEKEVKGMRGRLADQNLMLEKVSADVSLDSLAAEHRALKERNDKERKRVDALFTERAKREQQTKELEAQMHQLQRDIEHRITELAPDKRAKWAELQAESRQLTGESARLESQLTQLSQTVSTLEQALASNTVKQRALVLHEQVRAARQRRAELEAEDTKMQLSPEEAREQLIQRMRRDNAEAARAEEQARELEESVRRAQEQLRALKEKDPSSNGSRGVLDSEEARQQEEAEMRQLVDNFPSLKTQQARQNNATQERVTALETLIARAIEAEKSGAVKRRQSVSKAKGDGEKGGELAPGELKRMQQEVDAKKAELEKMDALEEKIRVELAQLTDRMRAMKEEMVTLKSIDELKSNSATLQHQLEEEKTRLTRQREALRNAIQESASALDAKRAALNKNDLHIALEKLENRLRVAEASVFQMQEFIDAKARETDYQPVLQDVTAMMKELEPLIQKAALPSGPALYA